MGKPNPQSPERLDGPLIEGTFTQTGVSASDNYRGRFNMTISGTFVGSVRVRNTDSAWNTARFSGKSRIAGSEAGRHQYAAERR